MHMNGELKTLRKEVEEMAARIAEIGDDKVDLLADLKQAIPNLGALYALTFHPDFARNRYIYVCYVQGGAESPDGSHISRFELTATDPPTLVPASEHSVLRWQSGGHNGCCLKFGPDGYL